MLKFLMWAGIGYAAWTIIAYLWGWWRDRREGVPGFWEVVRNPDAALEVELSLVERDLAVDANTRLPPGELVERLLLPGEEGDYAARAIEAYGPAIVPSLIAAIDDPRFYEEIAYSRTISTTRPVCAVLSCLRSYPGADAVPAVSALVTHEDYHVRWDAARVLGLSGSEQAIAPLRTSLEDEHDYVRDAAMTGILEAAQSNRADAAFASAMFDAVLPLLHRHDSTVSGGAPRCLLALDHERAAAVLTSPETLRKDSENLSYILKALREEGVSVSEAQLLALVPELEADADSLGSCWALAEALRLLARHGSPAARAAISRGDASSDENVREAAAEAAACLAGLEDPWSVVFDRANAEGFAALSEPQRNALAYRELIDEVNNGGLAQYFLNPSGDQWPEALRGIQAVGASDDEDILRAALNRFGPQGPSVERGPRHKQLARLARKDEPFDDLDTRFYERFLDREVLLLRYMIAHPEHFRPAASRTDTMRQDGL